jgi:serine/threonine-protein kinase
MNFIGQDDLLAAMQAWSRNKASRMGDILIDQQGLKPGRCALLDALVDEQLQDNDGDVAKSLASLGSEGRLREMISQIVDMELQSTGATPGGMGDHTIRERNSAGRFVVLRPHAKGGLGEVFVARDEELNRVVALKEIQTRYTDDALSRSRFIQEAEITGRLEHPGIVPVYGFGRYEDGRPYYAMRFIEGDSLRQAIDRYHASQHRTEGERSLELRKLLGSFVAVCQAVHYAHTRGVLHRDLKPDNIMLGQFGETLVVDWGLAKPVQQLSAEGSERAKDFADQPSQSLGDTPLTFAGTAVGTPAYMSPEQAAGRLGELGPATDVYSLGATLYYLLSGRAAFAGTKYEEVRRQIESAEFPRPRTITSDVSPPLEAVCLKAMSFRPVDRYLSARALSEDLEHWLADEPVTAWREPWRHRARRWLSRHRTLAAAMAAGLVVATLSLAGATALLRQANVREHDARASAERQRDETEVQKLRAQTSYQLARGALDEVIKLEDDPRFGKGSLEDVRRTLLAAEAGFYQQFVRQRGDDPEFEAERGGAYLRLAAATERLANQEDAIQHSQQAVTIYRHLTASQPRNTNYQADLAKSLDALARLYQETGRSSEAERSYRDAIDISARLVGENPTKTRFQAALARQYYHQSRLYRLTGRSKEEEDSSRAAVDISARVALENPTVAEYQAQLAICHNGLGDLLLNSSRHKEAESSFKSAMAVMERLTREYPTNAEYQAHVARSRQNLGVVFMDTRRYEEAVPMLQSAIAIREALAHEHPMVIGYQDDLARAYSNVGIVAMDKGQHKQAEDWLRKALAIQARVARDNPTVKEYQSDVANTQILLAVEYARSDRPDEAGELLNKVSKDALNGVGSYNLACAFSISASAQLKNAVKKRPLADSNKRAEEYAALAMDALRAAVGKGFRKIQLIRTDDDLNALRSRDDFKKLLAQLEREQPKPASK